MSAPREIKLYINGQFTAGAKNATFESLNPATGEVVAQCHRPELSDIDQALEAAHQAFYSEEWRSFSQEKRADLLQLISDKILERKKDLIDLEMRDSGSTLRKSKADIHNTASYFKVMSKVARSFSFERLDERASKEGFSKNYRLYEPVGVCAQIIPWNFPLVMAGWKLGPILATGCTTVLKTAEETPASAMVLAEILQEVGLPKGVVNIITGGAKEGAHLVAHPKVRKVAFTGSTCVGKEIMKSASQELKRVSLELGGKSANIVLEDADLDVAVDGALYAFLYHSGQACDSGTRLFIQQNIYSAFVEKFKARAQQIKVGAPDDPSTGLGPVINQKQAERILGYIEKSKKEGARLLFGGERLKGGLYDKGAYLAPTAFEITPDHTIFHEEIFGPVVGISQFSSEEEVIKLANRSTYGLAAAVWSKDHHRAKTLAKHLEAGTVWINEYHLLNPGMPFGGYKQSGLGREMGEEGLLAYLEVKHLWESDCDLRSQKPWFDAIF